MPLCRVSLEITIAWPVSQCDAKVATGHLQIFNHNGTLINYVFQYLWIFPYKVTSRANRVKPS